MFSEVNHGLNLKKKDGGTIPIYVEKITYYLLNYYLRKILATGVLAAPCIGFRTLLHEPSKVR